MKGNSLSNIITGNKNDDVIDGKGGNDILRGMKGNDTHIFRPDSNTVEDLNKGHDVIHTSVGLIMPENIEDVELNE